ncbi:MAG: hypothetical protein AAGL98_02485 [Planctomycetota bacterium]
MPMNSRCTRGLAAGSVLLFAVSAQAQLRVVTYNTNTFQPGTPNGVQRFTQPEVDTVIRAIGEETVNGISRAPDILLFQEHQRPNTTTQNLVDRLNAIYGSGFYARGFETGFTSGGSGTGTLSGREIRPTAIYRTDSVELISEDSFGFVSGSTQPRETLQYQFRPVGYGAEADFYVVNSHFKAGDSSSDLDRRFAEAVNLRDRADSFGAGANVIAVGDLNVDSSFEESFVRLYEEPGTFIANDVFTGEVGGARPFSTTVDRTLGDGQLFDPIDEPGVWNNNFAFRDIHTQSPFNSGDSNSPFTGGGIDDRFDFILTSGELLDDDGLAIIDGSYRAFGNNGSTYNDAINDGNTITINGLTSFTTDQVLDALAVASDHLPVVADFQLPAVLAAAADAAPATLRVGEDFDLGVTIANAADVLTVNGADELDYTLSVTGDLLGSASGTDAALGGGVLEFVGLDTATPGLKSGVITVATSSQGAANSLINLPISFEVIASFLTGDYNGDGFVSQADLDLVLLNWGNAALPSGWAAADQFDGVQISQNELDGVLLNWGNGNPPDLNAIPEPGTATAVVVLVGLLRRRRR